MLACINKLLLLAESVRLFTMSHMVRRHHVGHGGALVESIAFSWRVVGSTPALAAM